ncbi:MAG: F0F1 ATP synthase subunit gamma [Rickettsiales bacterium]|jgi:F-type H+-transporting ATPase subunit gamma|nr:F0F1 ATP synthase subunit gamma [Rickettsiales bacterium]
MSDTIDNLKKTLQTSKDIRDVVKTMKSLALTNIKTYSKAVESLYFYRNNLELATQALINYGDIEEKGILNFFSYNDKKKKNLIIIVGSNQGLCGRYNDRIKEFTLNNINLKNENKFIVIGNRLNMLMKDNGLNIIKTFSTPTFFSQINDTIFEIIKIIEIEFKNKSFNRVILYYTDNNETSTNGNPTRLRLFNITKKNILAFKEKKWPSNNIPTWNCNTKEMFFDVLKQYNFILLNTAIVNAIASELKNRLHTLQNAEQNINEMIKEKTMQYNQKRQMIITSQLIDIVSGFKVSKMKG